MWCVFFFSVHFQFLAIPSSCLLHAIVILVRFKWIFNTFDDVFFFFSSIYFHWSCCRMLNVLLNWRSHYARLVRKNDRFFLSSLLLVRFSTGVYGRINLMAPYVRRASCTHIECRLTETVTLSVTLQEITLTFWALAYPCAEPENVRSNLIKCRSNLYSYSIIHGNLLFVCHLIFVWSLVVVFWSRRQRQLLFFFFPSLLVFPRGFC